MLAAFVSKLLGAAGTAFLDRVLTHVERKADSETERQRIHAAREKVANAEAAGVIKEAMAHRVFWVVWFVAAGPTALWFGWGMLDSLMNGQLHDVSALPPQLNTYADIVFTNIFYVGGGAVGLQALASALRKR